MLAAGGTLGLSFIVSLPRMLFLRYAEKALLSVLCAAAGYQNGIFAGVFQML
jgi:hypothetical protein